ncbi:MAG: hypothetical protein LBF95_06915, partial [Treponema sp.]|nr:hypothetical protein [Treponema sp.]
MCKKILRVAALALVLSLVVPLGAFAAGGGQKASSGETTVLTASFITLVLQNGVQDGYYWTEILKEDLGIALDFVPSTRENFQTYLASQDLPDIVSVNSPEFINNMVQAGLMLNLD